MADDPLSLTRFRQRHKKRQTSPRLISGRSFAGPPVGREQPARICTRRWEDLITGWTWPELVARELMKLEHPKLQFRTRRTLHVAWKE